MKLSAQPAQQFLLESNLMSVAKRSLYQRQGGGAISARGWRGVCQTMTTTTIPNHRGRSAFSRAAWLENFLNQNALVLAVALCGQHPVCKQPTSENCSEWHQISKKNATFW